MHINQLLLLFLSFAVILSFTLPSEFFAQSVLVDKQKVKNFGKSLEKYKKDKRDSENQANQTEANQDNDVIKINTDLVICDVLVFDKQGHSVQGLQKDDFIVTENNNPQELSVFSLGDDVSNQRSIVLIIDYSGSQTFLIENSVNSAKILVDKLNSEDRMAIVTDDVELLQPFTNDKDLLKKKLESLKNKAKAEWYGKSRQYSALLATLNELFDEKDIRPIIIFQTDGDELFRIRTKSNPSYGNGRTNFTFDELYSVVKKSRATIYSVISAYPYLELSYEEKLSMVQQTMEQIRKSSKSNISISPSRRTSLEEEVRKSIENKID